MEKIFDGKKTARLGSEKKPLCIQVQTEERLNELSSFCEKNGWKFEIKIDPDQPENISDLEILLNKPKTRKVEQKVGRNDPCPCGSGKKYKKCCGR